MVIPRKKWQTLENDDNLFIMTNSQHNNFTRPTTFGYTFITGLMSHYISHHNSKVRTQRGLSPGVCGYEMTRGHISLIPESLCRAGLELQRGAMTVTGRSLLTNYNKQENAKGEELPLRHTTEELPTSQTRRSSSLYHINEERLTSKY